MSLSAGRVAESAGATVSYDWLMSFDSSARAAILAGALVTSAPDPIVPRMNVAPLRVVVPRHRPPLHLDAAIFQYRVDADGSVTVIDDPAGARACRSAHRHR